MDANYIGTIIAIDSAIDTDTQRITDLYILVCISDDMDTLEVRVSPELSFMYVVGNLVQIGIHGKYLIIVPIERRNLKE